mmetsp:Transcript_31858/g.40880  ORF Transcript_31858/g.40880 Transcript_31858/m.40880 type:complete len:394 (+) Transcript_31858:25-1206(+)
MKKKRNKKSEYQQSNKQTKTENSTNESKRKTGSSGSSRRRLDTRFVVSVDEDHKQPVYSVSFYEGLPKEKAVSYLATTGGSHVSIYKLTPPEEGGLDVVQVYCDSNQEEVFYSCAWTTHPDTMEPLLACGGLSGLIKIINTAISGLEEILVGHGNAINDIKFHPVDLSILLTASKDETLRLWNIRTSVCIAIFSGEKGHRDEVLSMDFHILGNVFASSGMDNSIKIWNLEQVKIKNAIKASYVQPRPSASCAFRTEFQQFPDFSTSNVHSDYVDCVRWVGNLILSKSTHNKIILWKPDLSRGDSSVIILREYAFPDCNLWYVRFNLDSDLRKMAVGNKSGRVFIWDVDGSTQPIAKITHPKCHSIVRHTSFSPDGRTLISVCDDASVWRWDIS